MAETVTLSPGQSKDIIFALQSLRRGTQTITIDSLAKQFVSSIYPNYGKLEAVFVTIGGVKSQWPITIDYSYFGKTLNFSAQWVNYSDLNVVGHWEVSHVSAMTGGYQGWLSVTKNQDAVAKPGERYVTEFYPLTLSKAGGYELRFRLNCGGAGVEEYFVGFRCQPEYEWSGGF